MHGELGVGLAVLLGVQKFDPLLLGMMMDVLCSNHFSDLDHRSMIHRSMKDHLSIVRIFISTAGSGKANYVFFVGVVCLIIWFLVFCLFCLFVLFVLGEFFCVLCFDFFRFVSLFVSGFFRFACILRGEGGGGDGVFFSDNQFRFNHSVSWLVTNSRNLTIEPH